jgi:hypothetical protein
MSFLCLAISSPYLRSTLHMPVRANHRASAMMVVLACFRLFTLPLCIRDVFNPYVLRTAIETQAHP